MKDKLRKKLITHIIISTLIVLLTGGIGIAMLIWLFTDSIPNNGFDSSAAIGIFATVIISIVFIAGMIALIQLCRDLKNVKHQKVITVSGIAKKHIWDSGGEGAPTITGAVVLIAENEEIRLSVGELILGEKYTFQYSPLTKTAVIVEGENKKAKSYFMSVKLPPWAASLIFLCLAIILGTVFLVTFNRVDNLVKNGIVATATVDEIKTTHDGEGSVKYIVYIKYDASGEMYREKLLTGYKIKLQIGEEIEIRYLPDNPTIFQRTHDEYAIPIIFGTFAGISLVVSMAFLVAMLIKRNKSNKKKSLQ